MKYILMNIMNKNFFTFSALVFFITAISLFSQGLSDCVKHEKQKKDDNSVLLRSFESYFKDKSYQKGKGWKQYKRGEYFNSNRFDSEDSIPSSVSIINQFNNLKFKKNNRQMVGSAWKELGPIGSPENKLSTKYIGTGRINCLRFHPKNKAIMYAGSASSGIWKSSDGGGSWTTNFFTQFLSMGISDIAVSPSNPDIIYAATGDANGHTMTRSYNIGIIKSTDAGQSWEITGFQYQLQGQVLVARILVHPDSPDTAFAATNMGIYKTIDGGQTWEQKQGSYYFRDMEFKPEDPNTIYAATFDFEGTNFIFKSVDMGEAWSISNSFTNVNRIALAVTEADPEFVYAVCSKASDNGFGGLYMSTNSGKQWSMMSESPNILGKAYDGSDEGGQGYYDLSIAASPIDKYVIFVGGIYIWKSDNSGRDWYILNHWSNSSGVPYIHEDQHDLVFSPNRVSLLSANDGGVFFSFVNGDEWLDISANMSVTQFYRLGASPNDRNIIFAGSQDNGTNRYINEGWEHVKSSDGMECIVDYEDGAYVYTSGFNGDLLKSVDSGLTFSPFLNAAAHNETAAWVTPYIIHPIDPKVIYVGYENLWKTTDRGETWHSYPCYENGKYFHTLAISEVNPDILYASSGATLSKSENGGKSWNNILTAPAQITYICPNPENAGAFWFTAGGFSDGNKVFYYNGDSLENISGPLINVPANCIVYQKNSNGRLFIGTDIGVFYYNSSNNDWMPFSSGMPHVIISELEIFYPKDGSNPLLRAATFGRGLWETEIYGNKCDKPALNIGDIDLCRGEDLLISTLYEYASYVWNDGSDTKGIVVSEGGDYFVKVYDEDGNFAYSDTITVTMRELPEKPEITQEGNKLITGLADAYQWYKDNQVISGANGMELETSGPGKYFVQVFNEYGCSNFSDTLVITSVKEMIPNTDPNIGINPNPGTGIFEIYIKYPVFGNYRIEIIDARGNTVYNKESTADNEEIKEKINISKNVSGLYFARISFNEKLYIVKFLKN